MSILSKLINLVKHHQYHIFLGVLISLLAFTSYNLGRISSSEKGIISVEQKTMSKDQKADIYGAAEQNNPSTSSGPSARPTKALDLRVVVSKNSDRYHYIWCPSVGRIKEENRIWFNTAEEAETNGYTLAGNCTK